MCYLKILKSRSGGHSCIASEYCAIYQVASVPLARALLHRKTNLVGTLRMNRKGLPESIRQSKLKKGEVVSRQSKDGIVVLKWHDKRDVCMLTTCNTDAMLATGKKDKQGNDITKPKAVVYYNGTKQGIDVSDQMASYHCALRKTIRWYHKVGIELLLGTAVVNAMLLYNERKRQAGQKCVNIATFREKLADSLLKVSGPSMASGSVSVIASKHYMRETEDREAGKRADRRKRRACIGCYRRLKQAFGRNLAKRKAKRVITECSACIGNPPFCSECFPLYHD